MQDVISRAKELIADGRIEPALQLLSEHVSSDAEPALSRAAAWRLISDTSRDNLDLERARHALNQAHILYREAGAEELELETELHIAFDDLNSDRYLEAEHTCTRILKRAEEQSWTNVLALAYEVRASLHRHRTEHDKSVEDCLTAIRLYSDLDDQDRIDRISLNLARSYACMGRFDLAKPYYDRGTAYHKKKGGLNSSVIRRMSIGLAAYLAKEFETAEEIYNEIIEDIKDLDRGFITSIVRQGMGMLQLTRGDFRSARKNLLISLQNIDQGEHRRMRVANLTALAIICVMLDEPQAALDYATLSRDNCFEVDDIESRLIVYYLAICQLANNNHELALDSWTGKAQISWTVEMQLEYEWMAMMLDHILTEEYSAIVPLSGQTQSLAEAWREEVLALNEEGCKAS